MVYVPGALQEKLEPMEATNVVNGSIVCRLLRRNGFTRKKIVQTTKQRCSEYRARFMADIFVYKICSSLSMKQDQIGEIIYVDLDMLSVEKLQCIIAS